MIEKDEHKLRIQKLKKLSPGELLSELNTYQYPPGSIADDYKTQGALIQGIINLLKFNSLEDTLSILNIKMF